MSTTRPVALHVSETLKVALISGRLKPGLRYSAPQLAREIGVSPTPVRQALLELERLDVVKAEPNAGFRILEPTPDRLTDLLELRLLIEVPALAAVAAACRGELAEQVRALIPTARDLDDAARLGDYASYIADDLDFHIRVIDIHGNRRLTAICSELLTVTRLLVPTTEHSFASDTFHEHEQMLRLILARDTRGVEGLMRAQLSAAAAVWPDTLEADASSETPPRNRRTSRSSDGGRPAETASAER